MGRHIGILILSLINMISYSQQDPLFSQYMYNLASINPGYAGSSDMICLSGASRQQWMGFEGNPRVSFFNANAPVKPFGISSGVGLSILSDNLGFDNNLALSATYAYRLSIGSGTLGIGVDLGFYNKAFSATWYVPEVPGRSDIQQPSQDPSIPQEKESKIAFDMGVGLFYNTDNLYFGISSRHINKPQINYETAKPYLARHYYAIAGYRFQLSNPLFEILPSAVFRSDARSNSFDVSALLRYNKKFWGGVSYRAGDAVIGIFGLELFNGLRFGFSYDFITSDIGNYSTGSIEIAIGYCFSLSLEKAPQKYKSIRFL
jgi:type IX secretion system PorP/SprF family membrane protein